jgi:hypothetical protein
MTECDLPLSATGAFGAKKKYSPTSDRSKVYLCIAVVCPFYP